ITSYLTTKSGQKSLQNFYETHLQLVNDYIGQFEKHTDAHKILYPSKKRTPSLRIDLEETWQTERGLRESRIQASRVSTTLIKAAGEKADNMVKLLCKTFDLM
ncbi:uncharacterized protein EV154DRAFT_409940, partial [Mucor mucedo]|uniref:uncharacterized protein n=1 Tax=Mucor mucedo TaxID=29922 RepID=UPI002220B6F9